MKVTLAFDVYGTLIDVQGVVIKLSEFIGDKAQRFSQTWRDKQLEYSFRRGLMNAYVDFSICTKEALEYTCSFFRLPLTDEQKQQLMECYKTLPSFEDAEEGLAKLNTNIYELYAFSNGSANSVESLLVGAGIRKYFDAIVSAEDLKSFKPNPSVYQHFLKQSDSNENSAWLISSNPFDVIGARSVGMKAVWVQRSSEQVFDPWGIEPTLIVEDLAELSGKIDLVQ